MTRLKGIFKSKGPKFEGISLAMATLALSRLLYSSLVAALAESRISQNLSISPSADNPASGSDTVTTP
jgi:hypothetical protein